MSALQEIADLVAPFTQGVAAPPGGRMHLEPDALERVRSSLPGAERLAAAAVAEWQDVLAHMRAAPQPILAAMEAAKAIQKLERQEKQAASRFRELLEMERDHFGGESAELLRAISDMTLRVLEALRDLRVEFIALLAKTSAPKPEPGPRSVAAIRRALTAL